MYAMVCTKLTIERGVYDLQKLVLIAAAVSLATIHQRWRAHPDPKCPLFGWPLRSCSYNPGRSQAASSYRALI
eukprot:COSAG01_NODE_2293_length_7967_cov_83.137646_8_plen_73_part_00